MAAASLSVVIEEEDEEEDDDEDEDEDDDDEEGVPLKRRAFGPVKGEPADGDPAVDGELS